MIIQLACILFLTGLAACSEPTLFVRYKPYHNTTVIGPNKASLTLVPAFKSKQENLCPAKCNLLPGCQIAVQNSTGYCSLYSEQVTKLDLGIEDGTLLLSNKPIQECLDHEYFADMNEKVCKLKFTESVDCSRNGECSESKGLVCRSGMCQCNNSDYK